MNIEQLKQLPSTFYRVAIKGIIFDRDHKLLVVQNAAGLWEIPGGGWEHGESFADCVQRELSEEIGVPGAAIGDVLTVLQGENEHGIAVIRIAVKVSIDDQALTPGDDMVAAKYVDQAEFMTLQFDPADASFQTATKQIWSNRSND